MAGWRGFGGSGSRFCDWEVSRWWVAVGKRGWEVSAAGTRDQAGGLASAIRTAAWEKEGMKVWEGGHSWSGPIEGDKGDSEEGRRVGRNESAFVREGYGAEVLGIGGSVMRLLTRRCACTR